MDLDYLVCGSCHKNFPLPAIVKFMQHKKLDCDDSNGFAGQLLCQSCPQQFASPWGLLQHAQNVHALQIYLEQGTFSPGIQQVNISGEIPNMTSPGSVIPNKPLVSSVVKVMSSQIKANPGMVAPVQTATVTPNGEVLAVVNMVNAGNSNNSTFKTTFQTASAKNINIPVKDIKVVSPNHTAQVPALLLPQGEKSPVVAQYSGVKAANPAGNTVTLSGPVDQTSLTTLPKLAALLQTNKTTQITIPDQVKSATVTTPKVPTQIMRLASPAEVQQALSKCLKGTVTVDVNNLKGASVEVTTSKPDNIPQPVLQSGSESVRSMAETGTQTTLSSASADDKTKSDDKEEGEKKGEKSCCDDQDCGVTVMPGTHEQLKKCCNAVVPKKRKRHMEMKHGSTSKFLKKRSLAKNFSRAEGTIFIDLEHSDDFSHDSSSQGIEALFSGGIRTNMSSELPVGSQASQKEHSVIIHPGSTISIPVSYPAPGRQPMFQVSNSGVTKAPGVMGHYLPVSSRNSQLQKTTVKGEQPEKQFIETPKHSLAEETTSKVPSLNNNQNAKFELSNVASTPKQASETPNESSSSMLCTSTASSDGSRELVGLKKRRYPTSRPYKCDQCDDAFNQRIHLRKHQSKHTGVKPFKCDQCPYSTVERSHLKVHIRVHTGEKPFKCTFCEYATAQNSTLKIHLKRHHIRSGSTSGTAAVTGTFQCTTCGKNFSQPESLNSHKQGHAQNTKDEGSEEKPSLSKEGQREMKEKTVPVKVDKQLNSENPKLPKIISGGKKTVVSVEMDGLTHQGIGPAINGTKVFEINHGVGQLSQDPPQDLNSDSQTPHANQ